MKLSQKFRHHVFYETQYLFDFSCLTVQPCNLPDCMPLWTLWLFLDVSYSSIVYFS